MVLSATFCPSFTKQITEIEKERRKREREIVKKKLCYKEEEKVTDFDTFTQQRWTGFRADGFRLHEFVPRPEFSSRHGRNE